MNLVSITGNGKLSQTEAVFVKTTVWICEKSNFGNCENIKSRLFTYGQPSSLKSIAFNDLSKPRMLTT